MLIHRRARLGARFARLSVLLLVVSLAWLFFGELGVWFAYSQTWGWPSGARGTAIRDGVKGSEGQLLPLRVLLLSDPHIQCSFDRYEPWVCRWDSDRYLGRAFSWLVSVLSPDMIVVLGDIFAEGFKASEQEWKDYIECMRSVFPVPEGVKFVVVAGDNDIGGEGGDSMREDIDRRYRAQFGKFNDIFTYGGVTFIKLNTVSFIHFSPHSGEERRARQNVERFLKDASQNQSMAPSTHSLRVLFSHVPLNEVGTGIRQQIIDSLAPDYVFSGHVHHVGTALYSHPTGTALPKHTQLNADIVEHIVPTCSYRMGEVFMGVGAAVIGDRELSYHVLWLPQRYPFLVSYLILLIFLFLCCCISSRCCRV